MGAKFCVIGASLSRTLSPMLHAAFGRENYGVVELADVGALKRFVANDGYAGFNVTMPFKRSVIPLLNELTDVAREVGAVNTVTREGGRLIGDNTDVGGLKYALEAAGIELADSEVLILGSGGAARAAAYLAGKQGARRVSIVSRTGPLNYANCYELKGTQVIINATPVGMAPHAYERLVDMSRFDKLRGFFDAVYDPLCTLAVSDARALGVTAAGGLGMLVEQARLAHNVFCRVGGGELQPIEASDVVAAQTERRLKNIVLIGMAGAGKTTIGRALAKALGREFFDTDEQIEKERGESISQIFAREGEAKFREYEARAVRESCSRFGAVIATGGGAPLREDNLFYMRANAVVVRVERDINDVALQGRPLSSDRDRAAALLAEREAFYRRAADICVRNDSDPETAVKNIVFQLQKRSLI